MGEDGPGALTVPGYEVGEPLGRGGFSVVYRARQVAVGREVALKILTAVDLDADGQRRFERECQALGALSWHPNIVVVHDAGRTDQGQPYIAMEHLPGGSLRDRVDREGPLPPTEVADIGVQAASALQAAHDRGLLHRDVKPDNLLIDAMGQVRLADFGIVGNLGTAPTQDGTLSATLLHAAPEVLEGRPAQVTADVYSLGSTLFVLADGRAAFGRQPTDSVAALLVRVLREPVPDLRDGGVPDALASAIEQAMAKDPAERFKTMTAFGAALEASTGTAPSRTARPHDAGTVHREPAPVAEPAPTAAPPEPPPPAPPVPPARGRPRRAPVIAAGVAIALLVVGAVALLAVSRAGDGGGGGAPATTTVASDPPVDDAIIDVGGSVGSVAIAEDGSVWAAGDSLARIDPATNEVVDRLAGLSPTDVSIGDGGMWATDFDSGDVVRVDPSLGEVTARVDMGEIAGGAPAGLTVAEGAVWTANGVAATMTRVDGVSAEVTGTSEPVGPALAVAVGEGSVWLLTEQSLAVFDRFAVEPSPLSQFDVLDASDIAIGEGSVWVTSSARGTVTRLDPSTGDVIDVIDVSDGADAIAVGAGSVWVTSVAESTLSRIDPTTNEVVDTVTVGGSPVDVAVGDDSVWVANLDDGTVSRVALPA